MQWKGQVLFMFSKTKEKVFTFLLEISELFI